MPSIKSCPAYSPRLQLRFFMNPLLWFVLAFAGSTVLLGQSEARVLPQEDYGPYNAVFLPDGPGLTEHLEPHDSLLQGQAKWTLSFWFRASEPQPGTVLLAGLGDWDSEDVRFICLVDNRLGLWLGK